MTVYDFFGVDSRILVPLIPDIFNICPFRWLFDEKRGGDKKTDEKENGVISEMNEKRERLRRCDDGMS